jgi:hypothetical protein
MLIAPLFVRNARIAGINCPQPDACSTPERGCKGGVRCVTVIPGCRKTLRLADFRAVRLKR